MQKEKIRIYQLLPRLAGNTTEGCVLYGTIGQNGCGKFNDLSVHFLREIRKLGISHIWLTGVIAHGSVTSWAHHGIPDSNPRLIKGRAGSPYAIRDYYDVAPDLAENPGQRMAGFEELIDRCHEAGLHPLIDFVPNHLARQYESISSRGVKHQLGDKDDPDKAFDPGNNFYYLPGKALELPPGLNHLPYVKETTTPPYHELPARVTGNDCFSHAPGFDDWYETVKLNYGVAPPPEGGQHFDPIPDTWNKMLDILLFWSEKKVSGFRCDMAGMVPVDFWQWAIGKVKAAHPHMIFIAEIYEPATYGAYKTAGFDFLYDKAGLYDTTRAVLAGLQPASSLSSVWQSLNGLDAFMLRFMENHDEQRIASAYFGQGPEAGIPAMTVAATLHQGPVMIYFGQELGEKAEGAAGFSGDDGRTSIFDYCIVPTFQRWFNNGGCNLQRLDPGEKKLRAFYQKLLELCAHPVVVSGEFYDLMYAIPAHLHQSLYAYLRWDKNNIWLVAANFSYEKELEADIAIPPHFWQLCGRKPLPGQGIRVMMNEGSGHSDKPVRTGEGGIRLYAGPLSAQIIRIL